MLLELMAVFCLLDDKGVIHIGKTTFMGWWTELMALTSNYFHEQVATMGLMWEPIAAPCTCS